MTTEDRQKDPDSRQRATERADELLERAGHVAGLFASMLGTRLARIAAFAREEAEDMWAEAQHMRQQYVSSPEEEVASEQVTEAPAQAKAETTPAGATGQEQEQKAESEQSTPPDKETQAIESTATARRRAEELGVNLAEVQGTGKGGKIITTDVKKKAQANS